MAHRNPASRHAQRAPLDPSPAAADAALLASARDPLDDAESLSGHAGPGADDPDDTDALIDDEERNATGGALPAPDDEDNDNDNDDARERSLPDHMVLDDREENE